MGAGDLGAASEVEALAGEVADVADEEKAGAGVDGGGDVVEGDVVVAGADEAGLNAGLAQAAEWEDEGGELEVGDDGVVAGAPINGGDGLVQPFGGVGEEGEAVRDGVEEGGDALLGAGVDVEDGVTAGHALALELAEAAAGVIMRLEPGGLAAGAEVGDPLEADEVGFGEEGGGGGHWGS